MATTTKSTKYFDLINSTEEELAKESNRLKAEGAHLGLQSRMLEVKKSISTNQISLQAAKANVNYNPASIYSYHNAVLLAQKELEFYEKLEKEQF